jgi:phosphopantothenoylcysteine synthetase/decarboxylase
LLGVTGGIAAFKAAEIASRVVREGGSVRVVMTRSATAMVGPLTFEGLTGHPVLLDVLATRATGGDTNIEHIAWSRWPTVALIAPLTAHTLARLAHGFADDALTATWLALPARVPSVLCPAMNTEMWENPATQRNLAALVESGRHRVVPPTSKRLACGDVGMGALADIDDILSAIGPLRTA